MTRARARGMAVAWALAAAMLGGCASRGAVAPGGDAQAGSCGADVARLQAQLAAEAAERQRVARAAARREESLRRQLDAMKSIERGILEREERFRTEMR